MNYNLEDLTKIVQFKTWSDKKKIDTLLEIDCDMYCNMGIDSSKTERELTKKNSKKIYNAIKQVNPIVGTKLIQAMD